MKTFKEWLAEYVEHALAVGKSPVYLRTVRFQALGFVRWARRKRHVGTADQLNRAHLDAWTVHLAAYRTAKGLPLKPSSVNKHIESVRGFLHWLAARAVIPAVLVNALDYIREPRLLPASVLRHAQIKALSKTIAATTVTGLRDRAIVEFLYSTGIRAGELCALDVADIDFENALALINGKGNKQRMVPIGKTALRLLKRYLHGVRPRFAPAPDEHALWLNAHGTRLRYHTLLLRVHRQAVGANLPAHVTPHTFRRSCTTELIRGGANLWHVKELLGHENFDTLHHYTRLTILDLKKTHARCHPRERQR